MERPLVFFVVVGVVLVLVLYYGGPSIFRTGPIATGPGDQGFGLPEAPPPLSFGPGGPEEQKPKEAGISPLQASVRISTVRYSESDFNKEYLIISSGGVFDLGRDDKKTINLDGWTIENSSGNRVVIPYALNIPSVDSTPGPIKLNAGEEALVITGDPPSGSSFRENICTGYFNEFQTFTPALEESCPEFSKENLLRRGLNATCIDAIDRTARCRQVRIGFEESAAGNECIAFAGTHLNYAGCIRDNKDSERFFTGRWRAFLKIHEKLWDSAHDRVILRDKDGLIVDEYVY